tara:strand:+ start:85 stop:1191 length:1107 start_codon:yes stop_codon:yes gene_type:complete
MIVGIPKEVKDNEKRVSLTPFGASQLVKSNHKVIIETNAGLGSGFTNKKYIKAGAEIVESAEEVFSQSDLIVKVKEPQENEIKLIKEDQLVFTFFHFAASKSLTDGILNTGSVSIAYETIHDSDGNLPILVPMSEVAGRMAVQNGAKCLEGSMGGKGKLLGGVPGVKPAVVTILGGGIVGANAAKMASGLGAHVNILDISPNRLRYLDDVMPKNVFTVFSDHQNIYDLLPETDLLIGAVLVVGAKAPNLVSKSMLSNMKYGSVIVDVAVDQGGCVETCRPTTHKDPTFIIDDVVHYCVSNMPGAVPYTSTIALTNVTLPYVRSLADNGINALKSDFFKGGLNTIKGKIAHEGVAEAFNLNYSSPSDLI